MGAIASRYRVYNSGLTSTDVKNVESEVKRENPGTLDEIHKKTKGIFYMRFNCYSDYPQWLRSWLDE